MALQFALLLPSNEILELLDQRVAHLEQVRADLADAREGFDSAVPALEAVIDDLFERSERNVAFELEWTEYLKKRVRAGAYSLDKRRKRK